MYQKALAAIALLIISFSAFAQHRKDIDELIASENAFAKMSIDSGAKKAFLQNFDRQSVTFDVDKPINAYDYWLKAGDKQPAIIWYPAMSAVSADGSLGYNIGPTAVKSKVTDEKPVYRGYFFSIWKRDSNGKFKVMLDGGGDRPMTADQPDEAKLTDGSALSDKPVSKASSEHVDIQKIDNDFNGNLILSIDNTYKASLADQSWLLRTNTFATTDKTTNLQHLKNCKINSYMLTCLGSGIAASNDLAYTYGKAELNVETTPGSAKHVNGFYYRTWQKFGSKWKIVADLVSY